MANESDIPDEESIAYFIRALCQHDKVSSVDRIAGNLVVKVSLISGRVLHIRVTNIYCVGEADVTEFLGDDPNFDVIVTLSAWNLVSPDASDYGRQREKGVFTWKEFFGSLNYNKFWLYRDLPYGIDSAELAAERRRRRRAWN